MKDSVLFEIVLAKMLGCQSESLSDADQREAILASVAELQLTAQASGDVGLLVCVADCAAELLGAASQQEWNEAKSMLTKALGDVGLMGASRNGSDERRTSTMRNGSCCSADAAGR